MKVSIIGGAGTLGATTAFVAAQKNIVDEICLIDVKENIAKSHEMDMEQALMPVSQTKVTSGSFEQLVDSDLVIITAGIPESKVASRMAYLEGNLKIMEQISIHLNNYCPQALIMNVSNPLDIITTMLRYFTKNSPERVIGFSLNDSHRFRWAIAKVLQVDFNDVQATVLGEHGQDQVPIFSSIRLKGEKISLTPEQQQEIRQKVLHWFTDYQALDAGRTSGWLSSINMTKIVEAIALDSHDVLPCSVAGTDGIAIGQLAVLGREGVLELRELDLTTEEAEEVAAVKQKIAASVSDLLTTNYAHLVK